MKTKITKQLVKKLSVIILLLTVCVKSFSQGSFINLFGTGGMGIDKKFVEVPKTCLHLQNIEENNGATTRENIFFSLGEGYGIGASFGHYFNKRLGIDLRAQYLHSKTVEARIHVKDENQIDKFKSNSLLLNPAFIISSNIGRISPYGRLGLLVGIHRIAFNRIPYTSEDTVNVILLLKGGVSAGYNASAGFFMPVSEKCRLMCEFQISGLTYSPRKMILKEYLYQGKDYKTEEFNGQTAFEFSDHIDEKENRQGARKFLSTQIPYSSASLVLGLQFDFKKDKSQFSYEY